MVDSRENIRSQDVHDEAELAHIGYKQELHRSLGSFSSFAAGYSYISVMTGMIGLFYFGFAHAGPAFFWTWPAVLIGQLLVGLLFAELAGQYPIAGSVFQWSKRLARPMTAWLGGWLIVIGSLVTVAAVAVSWQVVLPVISSWFEFVGGKANIGITFTRGGAENAIILGTILVLVSTVISIMGVKLMARINNAGVLIELFGLVLLAILFLAYMKRGPGVVLHTNGAGTGESWGFSGAFLLACLMSLYTIYGFDTVGSLAEETREPRRKAPMAIIRAILAAGITGLAVILFALMAVGNIHSPEIASEGLPYIIQSVFPAWLSTVFLTAAVISIGVCCLACQNGGLRTMFSMARDNQLPFSGGLSRVSVKTKTPIIAAVVTGVIVVILLAINVGNPQIFTTLTSVAIIMFYIAYLFVTFPMLLARRSGKWPLANHGPFFSLGKWGLTVNVIAVLYQVVAVVNLAWPRPAVYGTAHWYFQYGAFVFVGGVCIVGLLYYRLALHNRPITAREEHRADEEAAAAVWEHIVETEGHGAP